MADIDKVAFNFDPFDLLGIEPPKSGKRELKQQLANYLVDQVIARAGDGKSPVRGGSWKRSLSPEYKKAKIAQGGNPYADMILTGSMMTDLECVVVKGNLELRVKGKNAAKADGHNNHSGSSSLPPREFIPKPDGSFYRGILEGMREIIEDYNGESEN